MRTSEKMLTVVRNIQDLRKVDFEGQYLKFVFDDNVYTVFIENTDKDELQNILDDLDT